MSHLYTIQLDFLYIHLSSLHTYHIEIIYYSKMDSVTLASPFRISTRNNLDILSKLRNFKSHQILDTIPGILVPVLEGDDLDEIIAQNKRQRTESNQIQHDEISAIEGASGEVSADLDHAEPKHYVELAHIQPQNRQQQLATVMLREFPNLKRSLIEPALENILALSPAETPKSFLWSLSEHGGTGSHSELTNLFVRFGSVETASWLLANKVLVQRIFKGSVVEIDQELQPSSSSLEFDEKCQKLAEDVLRISSNKNNFSVDTRKTGTEDLDEVMQYYRTYKVANSELVEVPRELKETIVKDIIKFRAKVLTVERDRRKREIERERRMAKARLTQIVEGIKSVSEVKEETEMYVDTEEKTDPLHGLSEEEYQEHLEKQVKLAEESEYAAKLAEMEKLEVTEKGRLLEQLKAAETYELNLIENKFALIDELKVYADSENALLAQKGKLQLYFTNHSEYARIRNLEKTQEEKTDDFDRKDDFKADEKIEVVETKTIGEEKPSNVDMEIDVVVLELPEEKLDLVQNKIGELIEEFLGIREEVLVEFVFDFVKENNLSSKAELIAELLETLDDDSVTVVDQLHDFLRMIVTN